MGDLLFLVGLWGSLFGFLYPCIVGAALLIARLTSRAFRPPLSGYLSVFAPALTYYFLEDVVIHRQGWNELYAVPALSLFGLMVVVVSCALGKPRTLLYGSAAGVVLAIVLWLSIPLSVGIGMM